MSSVFQTCSGKRNLPEIVGFILRVAVSGIFLWSGITKLLDPKSFAVLIDAYGLLPNVFVDPTAIVLPVLEIIAGAGLLVDDKYCLFLVTGLLLLFMLILSYGIHMGLDIDCGCFGPDDPEQKAFHGLRTALFRDVVIFGGILFLWIIRFFRNRKFYVMLNKGKKGKKGGKPCGT